MVSNEPAPVRVLCAADGGYAVPLCVMLVSLVINHAPDRKLEIYVIGPDIPEEERRKIEASLSANRPDFELSALHWLSPEKGMLEGLGCSMHVTSETYSRLLAPLILPQDWDRILYLDCDMVIVSDLSPFYDLPFEERALLAVRDMEIGSVSGGGGVFNYSELGIPGEAPYFNAGAVLLNLRRWRRENFSQRIIEYSRTHMHDVHFWDQGGMNAILHDAWAEIDPVWNQHRGIIFPRLRKKLGHTRAEWNRIMYHPRIVHYTGPEKPWQPAKNILRLPRYSHFFKYLKKTVYRDAYRGDPWERILGLRLYFLTWRAVRETFLSLSGKRRRQKQQREAQEKENFEEQPSPAATNSGARSRPA
jgi:lipopolysaccharide biosynthesis glycosyltransferase